MAFWEIEGKAVEAGDLDAASEANIVAWVDGPRRGPDVVPATVRDAVRAMQRRAFDLTIDWPDEARGRGGLEPGATERLNELAAPTLVISGKLDIDSIRLAADHLLAASTTSRGGVGRRRPPAVDGAPDDFAAEVLDSVVAQRNDA